MINLLGSINSVLGHIDDVYIEYDTEFGESVIDMNAYNQKKYEIFEKMTKKFIEERKAMYDFEKRDNYHVELCYNVLEEALRIARVRLTSEYYKEYRKIIDEAIPMICPREGEFIGYKKGVVFEKDYISASHYPINVIIKLRIPKEAERSSGFEKKCRCSAAFVEDIWAVLDPDKHYRAANSLRSSGRLLYLVGEMVFPDDFDEDRFVTCSNGIHFFMTEEEAASYL